MKNCDETSGCVFDNVHRRMDDVHTLWHSALDHYFDPQKFRAALQSCIMQQRSVTFMLQNKKASIPDFENWYSSWQSQMANDDLMRWAKDSRNTIEKQGDLETHSRVLAKIIAEYANGLPEIEVEGSLFESVDRLLSRIDENAHLQQILKHGTLKIERRWVANTLPDFEILDALAEVYGMLSLLLDDAHRQVGLSVPFLIHPGENKITPVAGGGPSGGRLPCMIGHDERRATFFSLRSGDRVKVTSEPIDYKESMRLATERYGSTLSISKPIDNSLVSLAQCYFAIARRMFLTDGYHQSIVFLFSGKQALGHIALELADRSEKYLVMHHLATEVDRFNADRVMMICETWSAPAEALSAFTYPSDAPVKGETLHLWASSAQGENLALYAEIIRSGDKASLADTVVALEDYPLVFEPIRELWRKRRPGNQHCQE